MKDDYDFTKGQRGKFAKEFSDDAVVVVLDREVALRFPTSESVNDALKKFIREEKKSSDVTGNK